MLGTRRRALPADARASSPTRTTRSPASTASPWSAAAAARRPSTCARSSSGCAAASSPTARAAPRGRASPRSTSTCRSGRTRPTCRSVSGPTPTAPRRSARRCSPSSWDDCVEIARDQTRDGAHLLDLCVDYVGRDGVADMRELAGRLRHRVDAADRARLDRAGGASRPGLELLGGRAVVNSVNYEDGDGPGLAVRADDAARPGARRRGRRADHRRGGPGPHRGVEGRGSPTGSSTTSPATGGCGSRTSSSTA